MKRIILTFALVLLVVVKGFAQMSCDTLKISGTYTIHVVFPSEIKYVEITRKVINAKLVENSRNILALRASAPFDNITTISVLESSGQLHTFLVENVSVPKKLIYDYRSPSTIKTEGNFAETRIMSRSGLQFSEKSLLQRPQGLYHLGDRRDRIQFYCENIFIYGGETYFVFSLKNHSNIRYECKDFSFAIENGKGAKRELQTSKTLAPDNRFGTIAVDPGAVKRIWYRVPKFTLDKGLVLNVTAYETAGSRNLSLQIAAKDVNSAEGW